MSNSSQDKDQNSVKVEVVDDFVVEFRKYKTELTEKYKQRSKWKPEDPSKVLSFIPGTITRIFVKEGEIVEPGTELMVLEAMKMKNTVFAEVYGRITAVHAQVGEQVPKGKVIFEFDLQEA